MIFCFEQNNVDMKTKLLKRKINTIKLFKNKLINVVLHSVSHNATIIQSIHR